MLEDYQITKVKGLPDGGAERQHSVHSCMKEMQQVDIVLVHDAARPFITHDIIAKLVQNAHNHGAAIAGFVRKIR